MTSSLRIVLPLLVIFCWGAEAGPVGQVKVQLGQEQFQLDQEIMKLLNNLDPAIRKQVEAVFSLISPAEIVGIVMNMINDGMQSMNFMGQLQNVDFMGGLQNIDFVGELQKILDLGEPQQQVNTPADNNALRKQLQQVTTSTDNNEIKRIW